MASDYGDEAGGKLLDWMLRIGQEAGAEAMARSARELSERLAGIRGTIAGGRAEAIAADGAPTYAKLSLEELSGLPEYATIKEVVSDKLRAGAGFGSEGRRRAAWNRPWAPRPSGHGMRPVGGCRGAREGYVGTSRGGRRRVSESRRRYPNRDGLSRAACGRCAHEIAGGEAFRCAERLRCCATRPFAYV